MKKIVCFWGEKNNWDDFFGLMRAKYLKGCYNTVYWRKKSKLGQVRIVARIKLICFTKTLKLFWNIHNIKIYFLHDNNLNKNNIISKNF